MDTIKKLSDYAILNGSQIRFMGVPKTIDNDLAVTDHTPGFGSAAKLNRLHYQGSNPGRPGIRPAERDRCWRLWAAMPDG